MNKRNRSEQHFDRLIEDVHYAIAAREANPTSRAEAKLDMANAKLVQWVLTRTSDGALFSIAESDDHE